MENKKNEARKCPICRVELNSGEVFYCPGCGREIDYLLFAGISELSLEQAQEIDAGAGRTRRAYFLAFAVYATAWSLLYWFILRNCLTHFMR